MVTKCTIKLTTGSAKSTSMHSAGVVCINTTAPHSCTKPLITANTMYSLWPGGLMVKALGLRLKSSGGEFNLQLLRYQITTTGKLFTYIHVPLSPSKIIWYQSQGSNVLRLRNWHSYLSVVWCKWFAYGPADATATPSSLASLKSRMVYLSGADLARLSWKKAVKQM